MDNVPSDITTNRRLLRVNNRASFHPPRLFEKPSVILGNKREFDLNSRQLAAPSAISVIADRPSVIEIYRRK